MPYPYSPFRDDFNDDVLIPYMISIQNMQEFIKNLKAWLCQSPSVTTIRIDPKKPSIDNLINEQLYKLYLERSIAIPKVYKHATLDMLIIEHISEKFLSLEKVDNEVIVDGNCGAAVLRGAHIFAPGVVGMTKNCNIGDKVSIFVDTTINNKCKRGYAKVWHSSGKYLIANGIVKLNRTDLFASTTPSIGIAIKVTDTISGCPALDLTTLHEHGAMLQNLPSIVAVECLQTEKQLRLLDMCAAPGGKTTHIAGKLSPKAFFMACDKTPRKVAQLQRMCAKYKIENVRVECVDWLKTTPKMAESIQDAVGLKFDAILLDAPCSASGKRPQLVNSDTETMLTSFVALQKKLICVAADMLQPGGILVYSTCSVAAPENEGIVAYALKKLPLELVPAEPKHGGDGLPYEGINSPQFLQRFGPCFQPAHMHEVNDGCISIGFFIAKFIKSTDKTSETYSL